MLANVLPCWIVSGRLVGNAPAVATCTREIAPPQGCGFWTESGTADHAPEARAVPEEILAELREAEVRLGHGKTEASVPGAGVLSPG